MSNSTIILLWKGWFDLIKVIEWDSEAGEEAIWTQLGLGGDCLSSFLGGKMMHINTKICNENMFSAYSLTYEGLSGQYHWYQVVFILCDMQKKQNKPPRFTFVVDFQYALFFFEKNAKTSESIIDSMC